MWPYKHHVLGYNTMSVIIIQRKYVCDFRDFFILFIKFTTVYIVCHIF
jgi:hypothetical protein